MAKAQNQRLRRAIFGASTMAEYLRLILEALAIHFSFLPAQTLRDFTTMQMPSLMSKLKGRRIGLSSVRRCPFHIMSSGNSHYRVKSGISHSRSFVAMLLEIFRP